MQNDQHQRPVEIVFPLILPIFQSGKKPDCDVYQNRQYQDDATRAPRSEANLFASKYTRSVDNAEKRQFVSLKNTTSAPNSRINRAIHATKAL